MNVNVIKGKEIEFIELLYTLQNTINNEEHIDRFLNCLSIKKEDFNRIITSIEKMDCEIINKIFTRLKLRSTISINNAGKKYNEFSQGSLEAFLDSNHGRKLLGLYSIWQTICQINNDENFKEKPLLSSFYFYQLMSEYEYKVKTELVKTLNIQSVLHTIQEQLQIRHILEFATSEIYKEINNKLISLGNEVAKDEVINKCLEGQIPLYTSLNNYVFKIVEGTSGYYIYFTNEIEPIKKSKVEELDLRLCIYLPYKSDIETSLNNMSLHYEPTHQLFLADIQRMYHEYKQLFLLNPYSTIKKERLEAETCFIIPLYKIVKEGFQCKKVSQHLLFTITGLIAYDFGILILEDEYTADDNLSSYNDILRKKVMHIVNKNINPVNLD
nr:hypothetical protein [uncultured Carboxylicivirga sp.]